jgi:rhamnose utilization protein RhaD (predicted bifunctional aldolase and dehydrogenase)
VSARREQMAALIGLSHRLGDPALRMAILGEGNASARGDGDTFLVKASGSTLETLGENDVVECFAEGLLALIEGDSMSDDDVLRTLVASLVHPSAKKPSVEAFVHAWLLSLPDVAFVAHTHATAVTGILCSPRAREFAEKRVYPDEIVCCDVASVFVPYTDPGTRLARAIRTETEAFMRMHGRVPRVILLENHGIITLGRSADAALAAMLMAEKAAGVWAIAASLGGPVFLTPDHVARIAARPDEVHRRRVLDLSRLGSDSKRGRNLQFRV